MNFNTELNKLKQYILDVDNDKEVWNYIKLEKLAGTVNDYFHQENSNDKCLRIFNKECFIDFMADHNEALDDFLSHFNVSTVNDISDVSCKMWLYDHKQLFDDYKTFVSRISFDIQYIENFLENNGFCIEDETLKHIESGASFYIENFSKINTKEKLGNILDDWYNNFSVNDFVEECKNYEGKYSSPDWEKVMSDAMLCKEALQDITLNFDRKFEKWARYIDYKSVNTKVNKILHQELGVLLNKDDKEYDVYNNVWNNKYSYYDESQTCYSEDKIKEIIDETKKYVENGVNNTYGLISSQVDNDGKFILNEEKSDDGLVSWDHSQIDYDKNNILYSAAKINGWFIEDFITPWHNIEKRNNIFPSININQTKQKSAIDRAKSVSKSNTSINKNINQER